MTLRINADMDFRMPVLLEIPAGVRLLLGMFLGIAFWNVFEMVILVYLTFTRYRSLYFASICAATVGVLICSVSQVLNTWVERRPDIVPAAVSCLGWVPMVTGQSLLLYSRLHLLRVQQRILSGVLGMIIFNAVTIHTTVIVLTIGGNLNVSGRFRAPYNVMEKVQVGVFFLQEMVISGIYLRQAKRFLGTYSAAHSDSSERQQPAPRISRGHGHMSVTRAERTIRTFLRQLIAINIFVVALDVTILLLECLGVHLIQLTYKIFVYSVKLKCEIGILNRLVDFVKNTRYVEREQRVTQDTRQEWEVTLARTFGTTNEREEQRKEQQRHQGVGREVVVGSDRRIQSAGGTTSTSQVKKLSAISSGSTAGVGSP